MSSFMTLPLHGHPFTARIEFKVLLLVLKSQHGSAPKYLFDHIRPIYLPPFSALSFLIINTISFFLLLGPLWPNPGHLLLFVLLLGIASLLLFVPLIFLFLFHCLSLALSHLFPGDKMH